MATKPELGALLAARARELSLTYAEAGALLGMTQANFSRWVQGSGPRPNRVNAYVAPVARFLDAPETLARRLLEDASTKRSERDEVLDRLTEVERKVEDLLERDRARRDEEVERGKELRSQLREFKPPAP